MNFLEAKKIVAAFAGGPELPLLFAMSGTSEPLALFLQASAARKGRSLKLRLLGFNTLHQALLTPPSGEEREVFLLLPWDLVPELDWRSGLPSARLDPGAALAGAEATLARIVARPGVGVLYLPAPFPPAVADGPTHEALAASLASRAVQAGARVLAPEHFSLRSYFASGLPVAAGAMGPIASDAIELGTASRFEPAKLLVSDLDNTLWSGVIAEDGVDGIAWGAEGAGYRHFVYQTLLRRLKGEGVLLAAVSRNSPEVALLPLASGKMTLSESDFVSVIASYHSKSAQIKELAKQLNLGLNAVVFVDDNPVELQEVSQQLPEVQCVAFPRQDDGLPPMLADVNRRFGRRELTAEDQERTEMYRRRLEGMVPAAAEGADLHAFLRDLRMRLILHDRSSGDRTRAVQLINKTNQFNANGRRVTDEEVAAVLRAGGRLLTATLEDRSGSHGEILAALVTSDGIINSFVLSCRVFQRRVEQAFSVWLAEQPARPSAVQYAPTERNEPFQMFLRDPAFGPAEAGSVAWDGERYSREHADDLALFEVVTPVQAG